MFLLRRDLPARPIGTAGLFGGQLTVTTKRKTIRISGYERRLLVKMYLRRRIPIDQFEDRPGELNDLVVEWNELTRRTDAAGEIHHYMRNERKCGRWVRLDGNHERTPPQRFMSAEETACLVAIYQVNVADNSAGSDSIAYDAETANLIAKEFAGMTGRIVPAHHLVAKLTALRKRSLLPKACVDQAIGK